MTEAANDLPAAPDAKLAGNLLILSAVLIVFTMGHHPSGGHGQAPLLAGLSLSKLVHGAMIGLLLIQAWGLSVHTRLRGLPGWPQAALIVYLLGASASLLSGTINGFIVPALGEGGEVGHDAFRVLWEINQGAAGFGALATSLAILFWSIDLLQRAPQGRIIGGIGLVLAIGPAGAFLFGVISLNVAGAFLIYAAHALWTALIGWRLRA